MIVVAQWIVALSREKMTSAITVNHLSSIWTPDRAVEYLLLGGLLPEAVWFVGRLGDWKAQIMLSGIVRCHTDYAASGKLRSVIPIATFTFSCRLFDNNMT